MTRTPIAITAIWALALTACEPKPETTRSPEPTDPGSRLEASEQPGSPTVADPGKPAVGQALPRVRDRDPEEERRKMSLSTQRSAEAERFLGQGRLDDAARHAREALKIHEQNVAAMLVLADVFYRQGKFELTRSVVTSIKNVEKRTPEQESRAHNVDGFALLALGNERAATTAFRKAAELDPKNAAAWNNVGTRYLSAGDANTAVQVFKYAVELDPRFHKAHLNLGAAYRAQRKWIEAEQAMNKALQLVPNYAEAHFNLGVLYLDAVDYPGIEPTQRLNKAIHHLTKYRELAIADGPHGPSKRPQIAGKGKRPPDPVTPDRADEYIAVAKKGIEREERKKERDEKRKAPGSSGADAQTSEGAKSAVSPSGSSAPSAGSTSPQKPGTTNPPQTNPPSDGSPSPPSAAPPSQSPQKPDGGSPSPQKPSPQQPKAQRPGG